MTKPVHSPRSTVHLTVNCPLSTVHRRGPRLSVGSNGPWLTVRNVGVLMILWLSMLLPSTVFSQDTTVVVRSGFLSDSLKIGERVAFFLSAKYPSKETVLFPDSTFAFNTFEYDSKVFFPTETKDGISRDSAIYYLTTFEIDREQHLSLPVFVVHGRDCTAVTSRADTVLITQFVAEVPDSLPTPALPLKENTEYEPVSFDFNTVLLIGLLTVLLAAGLVAWALFGKKMTRYFVTKKLQKSHLRFLDQFNAYITRLKGGHSSVQTELALVTWKQYMEQLESKPYTKLTTKETQRLIKEPSLTQDLGRIDRAIYGHETAVVDSLENLKRFADQQFHQKLKEVQHG